MARLLLFGINPNFEVSIYLFKCHLPSSGDLEDGEWCLWVDVFFEAG